MTNTDYQYPDCEIILFAREPVRGAVKTRLMPFLTADQALALHIAMVKHRVDQLETDKLAPWSLYVSGDLDNKALLTLCNKSKIFEQKGSDLGARMFRASREALQQRQRKQVLVIGADCPGIDRGYLDSALSYLSADVENSSSAANSANVEIDIVLGPADDGGYVLIGMSCLNEAVFDGIPWGTADVLSATLGQLKANQLRSQCLAPLWDVDRPKDLQKLQQQLPELLEEAGIKLLQARFE